MKYPVVYVMVNKLVKTLKLLQPRNINTVDQISPNARRLNLSGSNLFILNFFFHFFKGMTNNLISGQQLNYNCANPTFSCKYAMGIVWL